MTIAQNPGPSSIWTEYYWQEARDPREWEGLIKGVVLLLGLLSFIVVAVRTLPGPHSNLFGWVWFVFGLAFVVLVFYVIGLALTALYDRHHDSRDSNIRFGEWASIMFRGVFGFRWTKKFFNKQSKRTTDRRSKNARKQVTMTEPTNQTGDEGDKPTGENPDVDNDTPKDPEPPAAQAPEEEKAVAVAREALEEQKQSEQEAPKVASPADVPRRPAAKTTPSQRRPGNRSGSSQGRGQRPGNQSGSQPSGTQPQKTTQSSQEQPPAEKPNRQRIDELEADVKRLKAAGFLDDSIVPTIASVHGLSEKEVMDLLGVRKPKGERVTQKDVFVGVQKTTARVHRGLTNTTARVAKVEDRVKAMEQIVGETILKGGLKAGTAGGQKSFIQSLRDRKVSDADIRRVLVIMDGDELELSDADMFGELYTAHQTLCYRVDEHETRITRVEELVEDGSHTPLWGWFAGLVLGLLVFAWFALSPYGVHGNVHQMGGSKVTGQFAGGWSAPGIGFALGVVMFGLVVVLSSRVGRRTTTTTQSSQTSSSSSSRGFWASFVQGFHMGRQQARKQRQTANAPAQQPTPQGAPASADQTQVAPSYPGTDPNPQPVPAA